MPVVVVESPAKAKTIEKYLGSDYKVLASFGHIRDLPEADGSVDTANDFGMKWQVPGKSQKHIRAITEALKADSRLILATDPDREGEAISWHVSEVLKSKRGIKLTEDPERVVFNAITKAAVTTAMENPRQIDMELVEAYFARRSLDYLVGFTLSPVLWRKLPGARSAGRVQSVCLRIIVEREMEIEAFKPKEHWTVNAILLNRDKHEFTARLSLLEGRKLKKFDLKDKDAAEKAANAVGKSELHVESILSTPKRSSPPPPFMTATLQQEASRKLGFNPRRTMRVAQALYEAGHITYMRTDGLDIAPEAVASARTEISRRFGNDYLPAKARVYKTKAKNAQEAHECIRPTDISVEPRFLKSADADQRKLYDLVRTRALASQMEPAKFLQTAVEIRSKDKSVGLVANGRVMLFDGYRRVYVEGNDDVDSSAGIAKESGKPDADSEIEAKAENAKLPKLEEDDPLSLKSVKPEQHFTKAPARYTEASLVKKMVELGIGRPSTYSSIVSTIQDRGYVKQEKRRLRPEPMGRLLTAFLLMHFQKYVEFEFTANLEEELDEITNGKRTRVNVLSSFWDDFSAAVGEISDLRISDVLNELTEWLAPHYFPDVDGANGHRTCPKCKEGALRIKTAKTGGAFFGCDRYPDCGFVRALDGMGEQNLEKSTGDRLLGTDPHGTPVTLRTGRFGPYVQLGPREGDAQKPKRASLPKGINAEAVDLAKALDYLSLPRTVGEHPEDKQAIFASIGPYGPYLKHRKKYVSLQDPEEVFTIGMNRAVELIAQKPTRFTRGSAPALKELGEHPEEGGEIRVLDGRYGPYVKWEKINATLPKDADPKAITLAQALDLIAAKASRARRRPPRKK